MRESAIESKVSSHAKRHGWLSYKWCAPNNRGVPDRIFIKNGRVIAIEFKAPGKKSTKLQKHVQQKLINEGIEVHVIDSTEDGCALFNS